MSNINKFTRYIWVSMMVCSLGMANYCYSSATTRKTMRDLRGKLIQIKIKDKDKQYETFFQVSNSNPPGAKLFVYTKDRVLYLGGESGIITSNLLSSSPFQNQFYILLNDNKKSLCTFDESTASFTLINGGVQNINHLTCKADTNEYDIIEVPGERILFRVLVPFRGKQIPSVRNPNHNINPILTFMKLNNYMTKNIFYLLFLTYFIQSESCCFLNSGKQTEHKKYSRDEIFMVLKKTHEHSLEGNKDKLLFDNAYDMYRYIIEEQHIDAEKFDSIFRTGLSSYKGDQEKQKFIYHFDQMVRFSSVNLDEYPFFANLRRNELSYRNSELFKIKCKLVNIMLMYYNSKEEISRFEKPFKDSSNTLEDVTFDHCSNYLFVREMVNIFLRPKISNEHIIDFVLNRLTELFKDNLNQHNLNRMFWDIYIRIYFYLEHLNSKSSCVQDDSLYLKRKNFINELETQINNSTKIDLSIKTMYANYIVPFESSHRHICNSIVFLLIKSGFDEDNLTSLLEPYIKISNKYYETSERIICL